MSAFSSFMDVINTVNPFYKDFKNIPNSNEQYEDSEERSVGRSEEQMLDMGLADGSIYNTYVEFRTIFEDKRARCRRYREMAMFPEITDSLDTICDDAIVENDRGEIINLNINEKLPDNVKKLVLNEFEYLSGEVFRVHDKLWDLFNKFMIEGEIYLEIILNKKKNSISGIKLLPAFSMTPEYSGNTIVRFIQEGSTGSSSQTSIPFASNQILYANYGMYGKNLADVKGFLETSVRTYNQLRNMEDALVIYRLVRAPERRVFNIDTGRMPKGKAEEYIKRLINKYKKRLNYDSDTGKINSSQNVQSLTEDFWFAKSESGESSVTNLSSGMQLGELGDVKYFLSKLYKTLKMPKSRWEESTPFSAGKVGEVSREEVKFSRFIERLQNRFKKIIKDALLMQLKLKGFNEKYIKNNLYDISFTQSNLFKEFKEREIMKEKVDIWSSISQYVIRKDNIDSGAGVFSREFALKNVVGLTDREYLENEKMRAEEESRYTKLANPEQRKESYNISAGI